METSIPQAYLLNHKASQEEIEKAITALSITPLYFVIVSDMKDVPLARQFGVEILKARTEDEAIEIAVNVFKENGMPSLVIGSGEGLIAIYADGRRESINVI